MVSTHLQVLKYLVEEDPDDSVNVVHMQVGGRGGEERYAGDDTRKERWRCASD